jgi:hypothetical protein
VQIGEVKEKLEAQEGADKYPKDMLNLICKGKVSVRLSDNVHLLVNQACAMCLMRPFS